jgi:hypothetical protein
MLLMWPCRFVLVILPPKIDLFDSNTAARCCAHAPARGGTWSTPALRIGGVKGFERDCGE